MRLNFILWSINGVTQEILKNKIVTVDDNPLETNIANKVVKLETIYVYFYEVYKTKCIENFF